MARTITGTIKKPGGNVAWAGVEVRFTLLDAFFATSSATYPKNTLAATTDVNGAFAATLATPDAGTVRYRCDLPDGESFEFDVSAGASKTLQAIIAEGVFPPATSPMVYLREDGTVVGATGTPQDFGTNGIKADAIAESSLGAGVTIDGVAIVDSKIARTGVPWGKNVLFVDAKGQGSYTTLSAALAAITDATANNPYTVIVQGFVAEAATVAAKSYVHVQGLAGAELRVTLATPGPAVDIDSVASAEWRGLKISTLGAHADTVIELTDTDESVLLQDLVLDTTANVDALKVNSGTAKVSSVKAKQVSTAGLGNDPGDNFNFIGGGYRNWIEDSGATYGAVIAGGYENYINPGPGAIIAGGYRNAVSAEKAAVLGGEANEASGKYSAVLGGYQAVASHYGEQAQAAGYFETDGDAQAMTLVMRGETANDTPDNLKLGADQDDGILLSQLGVWTFRVMVAVANANATKGAGFEISGALRRSEVGGEVTMTLISTPIKTSWKTEAGFDADVVMDEEANALNVEVTGLAGQTLRWVAMVRMVQVLFAR